MIRRASSLRSNNTTSAKTFTTTGSAKTLSHRSSFFNGNDHDDKPQEIIWESFYASNWGQSPETMTSAIPISRNRVRDSVPEFCKLITTNLFRNQNHELLILKAYEDMLSELEFRDRESKNSDDGSATSGRSVKLLSTEGTQSVGKTSFLIYILISRLSKKLSTIFQTCNEDGTPGNAYIFSDKGVFPIGNTSFKTISKEIRRGVKKAFSQNLSSEEKKNIWILFDSKPDSYLLRNFPTSFKIQVSGDKNIISQKLFLHYNPRTLYFNTWQQYEIDTAHDYFKEK